MEGPRSIVSSRQPDMPEPLPLDEVDRMATLARLALSGEERLLFATQLARILDYAGQVAELDLRDVPPTSAILDEPEPCREDVARPTLAREDALSNAPDSASGFFRVPKVLGDA
jgi:aspartyl-tRNA(Asn)/glutamyl-tRNA(Gln) amidotransferase subunit C